MVALKLGYLFWKKELVVEYHVEISQTREMNVVNDSSHPASKHYAGNPLLVCRRY
jgi:hypothetical protein